MSTPRVELLWWQGCPSWERALDDLRRAMTEAGLDPASVEIREIESESDAEREAFVGSPTIRVDGRDIEPPPPDQAPALACRVYRRGDGRISPLPDPDRVRHAFTRSAAR
jgi:hypothetical protein